MKTVCIVAILILVAGCANLEKPTGTERDISGNINRMGMNQEIFYGAYLNQTDDIPDNAKVYGLGNFFIGWSYFTPVYLYTWLEWENGFEYEAPVVTGAEYEAVIYVSDETGGKKYFFVQGLQVNGVDLTYFRKGSDGYLVAAFIVETDGISFPGTSNVEKLYSKLFQYKGGDIGVPEECKERAESPVNASYQIYVESDVFWGQSVKLDWTGSIYSKEFEVLAQGGKQDNYFVPTCSTQLPYRRTFGVAVSDTILHYLKKYSDGWYWHVCGFDTNCGGVLQETEDNLCQTAGLGS